MPVHPNFNPDYLYFVTTSTERHLHIFKHESLIRIILDSWHFLRTSGRWNISTTTHAAQNGTWQTQQKNIPGQARDFIFQRNLL